MTARGAWEPLEVLHAVCYFAPEADEALRATGLRGFWMGYFAARSAPFGGRIRDHESSLLNLPRDGIGNADGIFASRIHRKPRLTNAVA